MKRISIFIRQNQFTGLNRLADSKGISSAELIREAIDYKLLSEFGKKTRGEAIEGTRGILKKRFNKDLESTEIVDGLRTEWGQRFDRNKKQQTAD